MDFDNEFFRNVPNDTASVFVPKNTLLQCSALDAILAGKKLPLIHHIIQSTEIIM